MMGPKSPKVLKFDAACGCEGCGGGCAAIYSLRYVPSPRPCGHTERSEESGYLPLVMPTSSLVHQPTSSLVHQPTSPLVH